MGGRELIALEAVVPHQQPAGEPFVEAPAPIRKRRLVALERLLPSTTPYPVMPS